MVDGDDIALAKLETDDFELLRQAYAGWDHEYFQLDAGLFHGSLMFSQMGSLQITRNFWGVAFHTEEPLLRAVSEWQSHWARRRKANGWAPRPTRTT